MHDVAREQGLPFEPDREDNIHRLNMGTFPVGASIIPNPYNKIPGFFCGGSDPHAVGERGGVYFVPGFPVMAWPTLKNRSSSWAPWKRC
jgi:molybdopterin-biosynthesis enzyme MoeA-like protein